MANTTGLQVGVRISDRTKDHLHELHGPPLGRDRPVFEVQRTVSEGGNVENVVSGPVPWVNINYVLLVEEDQRPGRSSPGRSRRGLSAAGGPPSPRASSSRRGRDEAGRSRRAAASARSSSSTPRSCSPSPPGPPFSTATGASATHAGWRSRSASPCSCSSPEAMHAGSPRLDRADCAGRPRLRCPRTSCAASGWTTCCARWPRPCSRSACPYWPGCRCGSPVAARPMTRPVICMSTKSGSRRRR